MHVLRNSQRRGPAAFVALLIASGSITAAPALAGTPPTAPTYVRTIGHSGEALMYPSGLDVDAAGNVVVADTGNDRIEMFAAGSSTPTWSVGVRGAPIGGGTDSFENPRDVAVDANFVYVADTDNQIIQVLNKSNGSYVQNLPFKFATPIGITIGSDGAGHERILVSNGGSGTVELFDTAYNHTLTVAHTTTTEGTRDAATDSLGNIYTADYRNNRVDKYSPTGTLLLQWGGTGAPVCQQVPKPYGVAVDASDHIYIASSDAELTKEFNPDGSCVASFGTKGKGPLQIFQLRRVAVGLGATSSRDGANPSPTNPPGTRGAAPAPPVGSGPRTAHLGSTLSAGASVASAGLVYEADLWGLKVLTYNQNGTISTTQPELGNGILPAVGGLNEADTVAVTSSYVYVTDTVNQRMQRFDLNGANPISWGTKGVQESTASFNWAQGIGVDPVSGNVWVANTRNNRIDEFGPDGSGPLRLLGQRVGGGSASFNWPMAVSFDPAGNMYVADTFNDKIQSYSVPATGAPTLRWSMGTHGMGTGNFSHPWDVVYDGTMSRLIVVDTNNSRLVALDAATGAWQSVLPMARGVAAGQVRRPFGVGVSAAGKIWVADTGNNRIEEFNSDGTFANEMMGSYGTSNSQFNAPQGIQVGPDGLLYVADASNNRVQVFQP